MLGHSSQYLEMHAKDPVHWQLWGPETLKKAQEHRKPILISSGYFACHWCHVMQEENYQNTVTADLINQHYIPVKIDRELQPDLDSSLIDFAKKTTGRAGWPQHVILTPEGYPFSSFIYLPNSELNVFLQRTATLWQQQANQVSALAKKFITSQSQPNLPPRPTEQAFKKALFDQLTLRKDELSGGLQSTSKFPKAPLLNTLLRQETLSEEIEEWLITTLDQMQREHLIDHIHGGFYRYTVDPEWQTPHFEKMAYNSALLANTYLLAAQKFNHANYLTTAKETLQYLREHLFNDKVGLYQSSQSAIDQNGIEGGDYIFSRKELKNALTADEFHLVLTAWRLDGVAPYSNGWLPRKIDHPLWSSIKQKLSVPADHIPKDQKGVLSWNGLILSALSTAYQISGEERYVRQANALANRLINLITLDKPPRAVSATSEHQGHATLEDFSFILQGLRDLDRAAKHKKHRQEISDLEQRIPSIFYQNKHWQFEAHPLLPTMQTQKIIKDDALPSAVSSVACLVPNSITNYHQALLTEPLQFASFLGRLNCLE